MSVKRKRQDDRDVSGAPRKLAKFNTELAQIWERLADDSEETRLNAALELVEHHLQGEDLEHIIRRLFRGLCSGRKNARPGFYIALVGALSTQSSSSGSARVTTSEVIAIYEAETTAAGETSGEDDRNHYYGKLLGAKAIVESGLLSGQDNTADLVNFLTSVIELMARKPWLRMEGAAVVRSALTGNIAVDVLQLLNKYKLVRTVDGLAVWLDAQHHVTKSALPKGPWTDGNPLASSELANLKKVLLSSNSGTSDADNELTGTTMWSTILNPAWTLILQRLAQAAFKGEITFERFWAEIVDEGLFGQSGSQERKLTGLLVFTEAFKQIDTHFVPILFSKNVVSSLMQGLSNTHDTYLAEAVRRTVDCLIVNAKTRGSGVISETICGLLLGCELQDFDSTTKTNTIQLLCDHIEIKASTGLGQTLLSWLERLPTAQQDAGKSLSKKRNLLNILQRAISQSFRLRANSHIKGTLKPANGIEDAISIIEALINLNHKQSSGNGGEDDATSQQELLKEKTQALLEALLSVGPAGQHQFLLLARRLPLDDINAEASIYDTFVQGVAQLDFFLQSHEASDPGTENSSAFGITMLLALTLYQVYDGDEESVNMLEEVVEMAIETLQTNRSPTKDRKSNTHVADAVVDIVLGFSSKPSKLFRKSAEIIFGAFSKDVSYDGLKALCRVLQTKETREGQQELFDNGDDDTSSEQDASNSLDEGSISGEGDSDVEIVQMDDSASDPGSETSTDSSDTGSEVPADDEELTNFESALAAALQTRKLNENDLANMDGESSSDSDSDMSDSQMMELDEKLAEVFKNQQNQASIQKVRKAEMRTAKENIINLKNRALDLVELFLHKQQARGYECSELLSSLLDMAGNTNTQQLAIRGLDQIKSYCRKAKGAKLPEIAENEEMRAMLETQLKRLHLSIVKHDASNALIEVAAQLHLLLCKLLMKAGVSDIEKRVDYIVAQSNSRQKHARKALQDFWGRYHEWMKTTSAGKDKGDAKVSGEQQANGKGQTVDDDNKGTTKQKKRKRKNGKSSGTSP